MRVDTKRVALWWLLLFGVWPLADPGHDAWSNPLVWLDLAIHGGAAIALLNGHINRRVRDALAVPRTVACTDIDLFTSDGRRVESITFSGTSTSEGQS